MDWGHSLAQAAAAAAAFDEATIRAAHVAAARELFRSTGGSFSGHRATPGEAIRAGNLPPSGVTDAQHAARAAQHAARALSAWSMRFSGGQQPAGSSGDPAQLAGSSSDPPAAQVAGAGSAEDPIVVGTQPAPKVARAAAPRGVLLMPGPTRTRMCGCSGCSGRSSSCSHSSIRRPRGPLPSSLRRLTPSRGQRGRQGSQQPGALAGRAPRGLTSKTSRSGACPRLHAQFPASQRRGRARSARCPRPWRRAAERAAAQRRCSGCFPRLPGGPRGQGQGASCPFPPGLGRDGLGQARDGGSVRAHDGQGLRRSGADNER